LLDFAEDHFGADGVRSAGGEEKSIAGVDGVSLKETLEGMRSETFEEFFLVGAGFQADENLRAGFGGDGVPHFGFAAASGGFFVDGGVGVIGMDLDGEFVVGEDEFYEEGEVVDRFFRCFRG